jgi:hypothetical protein
VPCVEHERCFYCKAVLSPNHEHDHFPVPDRHGGTLTVPACLNCHDLKDRIPLGDWFNGAEALTEFWHAFDALPLSSRLLLGKIVGMLLDAIAELDRLRSSAEPMT